MFIHLGEVDLNIVLYQFMDTICNAGLRITFRMLLTLLETYFYNRETFSQGHLISDDVQSSCALMKYTEATEMYCVTLLITFFSLNKYFTRTLLCTTVKV